MIFVLKNYTYEKTVIMTNFIHCSTTVHSLLQLYECTSFMLLKDSEN